MPPVSQRSRTAQRSLVATLEIVGFAAGAHVLAGGHLPAPGFLLALGAVVLVGALLSFGRRLHPGIVVAFVLAAQVALHASFEAASPVHAAMGMRPGGEPLLHLTPPMIWAHLITTVLTAIVLLGQERALAVLTTLLRDLVLEPAAAGPRGRRSFVVLVPGDRAWMLGTSPRRGPPVLLTATP